jgi:hypothetical protein
MRFSIAAFFAVISAVALLISGSLTTVPFLLLVNLTVLVLMTRALIMRMPKTLLLQSEGNCRRLDGSYSSQRARWEQRARNRTRSDLVALMLLVFIAGNLSLLLFSSIFPLDLLPRIVASASSDTATFKANLRQSGVERGFEHFAKKSGMVNINDIEQAKRGVWLTWPLIVVLVFALVIGFAGFIRFAYLQTLSNFEAGINKRAEVYLKRDLTRLQTSDEELCG